MLIIFDVCCIDFDNYVCVVLNFFGRVVKKILLFVFFFLKFIFKLFEKIKVIFGFSLKLNCSVIFDGYLVISWER